MRNRNNYDSLHGAINLLRYELGAKNINDGALRYLLVTINKIITNQHIEKEVDAPILSSLKALLVDISTASPSNKLKLDDVFEVVAVWDMYQKMNEFFNRAIQHKDIELIEVSIRKASNMLNEADQFILIRDSLINYSHQAVVALNEEPASDYSEEDIRNIFNKVYSLIKQDYPIMMSSWNPFIIKTDFLRKSSAVISPRFCFATNLTTHDFTPLPETPGKYFIDEMDIDNETKLRK